MPEITAGLRFRTEPAGVPVYCVHDNERRPIAAANSARLGGLRSQYERAA
jgi:hypothetical protein